MFTIDPGTIAFTDSRPGNHATMFGPRGERLQFRNDRSSFSDHARAYTWAFEYTGAVEDGDEFVFATADRDETGEAEGGKVVGVGRRVVVSRDATGKPQSVVAGVRATPGQGLITIGLPRAQRKLAQAFRCLFVNPSVPYNQWNCYKTGAMNEASFSAHGAAYVSATLKAAGHHCWMVDLRSLTGWQHVEDVLRAQEYDVAFVGFLSIDAFNAACVVRILKEVHPDRPVVVGGLHVSIAKEHEFPRDDLVERHCWGNDDIAPDVFKQFLAWKGEGRYEPAHFPKADYVILDDGEIAARDLVAELAAGRRPGKRTWDGGAVPMEVARHLDRDLFDLNTEAYSPILPFQPTPMVTVTWARGCPFRCSYSVTGDTIVSMEDGPIEIAKLAVGEAVHRECDHGGRVVEYAVNKRVRGPAGLRLATVVLDEGVQPVWEITLDDARTIKATAEHRFWGHFRGRNIAEWLYVRDIVARGPSGETRLKTADGSFKRIVHVEKCPPERVYDITVPEGEAFYANGIASHNCNLASQISNTNVRQKPVELVEEELDDLHRRFGGRIGSLMIHDDLTFHPKHIAQWCELILKKYGPIPIWLQTRADWVVTRYQRDRSFWDLFCRAGLTWTSVGYESGSQRVLDFMQKDNTVEKNVECGRILDEYGINSFGNFLWGVPTETREEAEETVALVQKIRPGFLSGSVYCNYPGTQLDAKCRAEGLLVDGQVYTRSHLPWQITVKGVDYGHVNDCVRRAGEYANYLRMPKMLTEDRKRELAASSRGLAIH